MNATFVLSLRLLAAVVAFVVVSACTFILGRFLLVEAASWFPPDAGNPSTDPRGRGVKAAVDIVGLGPFICVLLGGAAGWLAWLATDRRNWNFEFWLSSVLFLVFAVVSAANYANVDIIFTRDAQAVLNIFLVASTASLLVLSQAHIAKVRSVLGLTLVFAAQALCIFAFLALPLWYSISFLSWKLGAGQLTSLDSVAKAIAALASLAAAVGLNWKDGRLAWSQTPDPGESDTRPPDRRRRPHSR